jgi:Flp pilus assembly protein TadG
MFAMWQAIRRFMVETEGAALLEFTLSVLPLVTIAIYTMDFGLYFLFQMAVQNAAQAGAQYAIVYGYSSSSISSVVTNATNYTAITASSTQFCGCPSATGVTNLGNVLPCSTSYSTCSNGSSAGTYVTVTATPKTAYQSFVPYGLFSTSPTVGGSATVRLP